MASILSALMTLSIVGVLAGPAVAAYGLVNDRRKLAIKGFMVTPVFIVFAIAIGLLHFAVTQSDHARSTSAPDGLTTHP